MKYILKDPCIEAIQWTGENETDVRAFLENKSDEEDDNVELEADKDGFVLRFPWNSLDYHLYDPWDPVGYCIKPIQIGDYIVRTGNTICHMSSNDFDHAYKKCCNTYNETDFMIVIHDIAKKNSCLIEVGSGCKNYEYYICIKKGDNTIIKYIQESDFNYDKAIELVNEVIQELNK